MVTITLFPKRNFSVDQVPNLIGKRILVTGGIGLELVKVLAEKGADLLILSSRPEAATHVRTLSDKITLINCDLSSIRSTREAAAQIKRKWNHIDIIFLNAGIGARTFQLTADGVDLMFEANYLGPYVLIKELLEVIEQSAQRGDVRIVSTTSASHYQATGTYKGLSLDKMMDKSHVERSNIMELWDSNLRYGQTKLANILFTKKLDRLFKNKELNIFVNCAHPGMIRTSIMEGTAGVMKDHPWMGRFLVFMHQGASRIIGQHAQDGALSLLYLGTSPDVQNKKISGDYYVPIAVKGEESDFAKDEELQDKLWNWSENVVSKI